MGMRFNQGMNEYPALVGMERNITADAAKSNDHSDGSTPAGKLTVVYACSGCSDAGELADRTARTLAQGKLAEMSCLAGIGGRVKSLMLKAERAEDILVIDGCPLNCARKTLELAGFKNFRHLELHKLGLRKGSCPVALERIALAVEAAAKMIEESPAEPEPAAISEPVVLVS